MSKKFLIITNLTSSKRNMHRTKLRFGMIWEQQTITIQI